MRGIKYECPNHDQNNGLIKLFMLEDHWGFVESILNFTRLIELDMNWQKSTLIRQGNTSRK